jgi:hypothetical protein
MSAYTIIDTTRRPDGCYVSFAKSCEEDSYRQIEGCDAGDEVRWRAWQNDDWRYIGVGALARIIVVRDGVSALYTIRSAGVWGIESDSDPADLDEIYADEVVTLKAHLLMFATASYEEGDL